jgi:two-component system nitrogen regulation sensor histidine kinase GlnL
VQLRTRAETTVLIGDAVHRLAVRVEIADRRPRRARGPGRAHFPAAGERAAPKAPGSGLPLAQQVAREHGGSLGYRSRPGTRCSRC